MGIRDKLLQRAQKFRKGEPEPTAEQVELVQTSTNMLADAMEKDFGLEGGFLIAWQVATELRNRFEKTQPKMPTGSKKKRLGCWPISP